MKYQQQTTTQIPFGSWSSPINTGLIVKDAIGIDEIQLYQNICYWIEKRPSDNGRCVIVQYKDGNKTDYLPDGFSARSRAHEYGGASYCVSTTTLYFINDTDQQIYSLRENQKPQKITSYENCRFTDMAIDSQQQQIICICEDHSNKHTEPVNTLVTINIKSGTKKILAEGYSFYSNPVLSSNDQQLAWLCWNHPNMPWDGSELWLADITDNQIHHVRQASGSDNISVCQPRWSPGTRSHLYL